MSRKGVGRMRVPAQTTMVPRCWMMNRRESPALARPSGDESPAVTCCNAICCAAAASGTKRASRSTRRGMILGLISTMRTPNKNEIRGKLDEAVGTVKEEAGRTTADIDLQNEGEDQRIAANAAAGAATD